MSRAAVTRRRYAPMRWIVARQTNHPASPVRWRCLLCDAVGSGGALTLTRHFADAHG